MFGITLQISYHNFLVFTARSVKTYGRSSRKGFRANMLASDIQLKIRLLNPYLNERSEFSELLDQTQIFGDHASIVQRKSNTVKPSYFNRDR